EEPHGTNPPAGAVIDYLLRATPPPAGPVTVEIRDARGNVVRRFSSDDRAAPPPPPPPRPPPPPPRRAAPPGAPPRPGRLDPAGRRVDRLSVPGAAPPRRSRDRGDSRRARQCRAAFLERRPRGAAPPAPPGAAPDRRRMAAAPGAAHAPCRAEPLCVGPALSS